MNRLCSSFSCGGKRLGGGGIVVCAAVLLLASPAADAQDAFVPGDQPVIRVEEDWLLDIADADPELDIPQVVTVFGPADPTSGTHAIFELNHGTQPTFGEGGMQLQCWWGDYLVGYQSQHTPTEFNVSIERVTYTTRIELVGERLEMSVVNGSSTTFGDFGGTGALQVALDTFRESLDTHNPEDSIVNSRVTFGANRVNKFVRSEIRYYSEEGLLWSDSTEAVIHRLTADTE